MRASLPIAIVLLGSAGCGGGTATPTERLWISGLPTKPTARFTAFATTRATGDKYLGAFFRGSVFRGGHDVFQWQTTGTSRAELRFLQDGQRVKIELETCKPSTGFDYCLLVHGDPTGVERYQSRKRWVVRRPGRRRDVGASFVLDAIEELGQDDPELAALLAEAVDSDAQPEP